MAIVVQYGDINTTSILAPEVVVQIIPPSQTNINGVPTNIVGVVGTAIWGPKNVPVIVSDINNYAQQFGLPQTNKYDMGTAVYAATLNFANNFRCVRVTDGTDTAATSAILDAHSPPFIGMNLVAFYTGSLGNSLSVTVSNGSAVGTYKIIVALPNRVPEEFDNIGGTGTTFWQNAVNAINLGQSGARGPSQLVIASLSSDVIGATVTAGGSHYTTAPTVLFSGGGGTGAMAVAVLGYTVASANVTAGGSGYTTATATITGGGGSGATATVTVVSGAVTAVNITNPGSGYTSAPTISISGEGTGAAATAVLSATGSVTAINITNSGTGYTSAPTVSITGGGGSGATATATIGNSTSAPALNTYTFSGGTDGISGVTATTLMGSDVSPRTGMYALRSTQASIVMLADCDNSTTYTTQAAFGLSEGCYMMLIGAAGQTPAQAAAALQTAGVDSYDSKFLIGDWCYMLDPFNNVTRLVSPQGFIAGRLANLAPNQSSLNKPILGILGTQTSYAGGQYTQADIVFMEENRLDVIANPSPGGAYFAAQTGLNTSSNPLTEDDGYPRLTNYIAYSIAAGTGLYIGQLQTPSVRLSARNTLISFLKNLETQGLIGDVNGGPAFKVILDASNNPSSRVVQGFMQADIQVVDFSVIRVFLINLQNGQVSLQSTTPNQ